MIFRHLPFTLRTLRRHAGAYFFAVAVLAAGIGLSTAIFSLVQAVLLRPLPYPNQDALRVIWKQDRKAGVPFIEMAYPELGDLQGISNLFESVAVMPTTLYGYGKVIQVGTRDPVQVESAPVSHDFFRTLGVSPVLGRDFSPDDEHPGAGPVVILSDHVWREQFGHSAGIVGRQIRLNGIAHTVIGIMAPAVDFPRGAGLWVPLGVEAMHARRDATYLQAIARVRPGIPDAQVKSRVNALLARLATEHPDVYSPAQEAVITPLPEYWTGSIRMQLYVALGASLLLLAMACITASNLFLSRTFARAQEVATRASLGASPWQIAAQFLVDGVVAASLASIAGLALAWALMKLLVFAAPADIPRLSESHLDRGVLLFAALIGLAAALACALAPALAATRMSLETVLRETSGRLTATSRARRWQNGFTTIQTAATVILLSASLLIAAGVRQMLRTDTGFARRDTLTMNLAVRGMNAAQRRDFYGHLLTALRDTGQVEDAAGVLVRPFEGAIGWDVAFRPEFEGDSSLRRAPISNFEVVTPAYFRTVGTPLLEGRDFTEQDFEEAVPAVIVSHSLAERFRRQGHEALGLRLRLSIGLAAKRWTIIGVAADTRYRGINAPNDDIYVNYRQTPIPVNYLVVRGPLSVVRREVARLDAGQAIAGVATIEQLIDRNTARQRFSRTLLMVFGLGAILLAGAGVFGVVQESVATRRRELAICTVLGAGRGDLLRRAAGRTLRCAFWGALAGCVGAVALGRSLPAWLDAGRVVEWEWMGLAPVVLLAISVVAAGIPAWAASGEDPKVALQ